MRPQAKNLLISLVPWIVLLAAIGLFVEEVNAKREEWPLDRKFWDMGNAVEPKAVLTDDEIHIAYFDRSPCNIDKHCHQQARIVYARSVDWGHSWTHRNLRETCEIARYSLAIASSGDSLYIVWSERDHHSEARMIVAVSPDRGRTWNDLQVLAHRFIDYNWPNIVTEGDSVFVTYQGEIGWDKNLYVVGSDDRGMHWSDENAVPLVDRWLPYGPAVSDGNLYIAITVRGANESWQPTILRTSDSGRTWNVTVTDIRSDRLAFICEARISGGEIRVLTTAGYSKSSLDDLDWSTPNADIPCGTLLGSDSTLHVFRQPGALVRQSSFDGGDNWTENIIVLESTNKGIRDYGIGFENDNIVVVYSERKSADEYESQEVYFIVSNNGGVTWSTPQRITDHMNELAIPLFTIVVSLFVFLTLLVIWLLRELVRARRKLPIHF